MFIAFLFESCLLYERILYLCMTVFTFNKLVFNSASGKATCNELGFIMWFYLYHQCYYGGSTKKISNMAYDYQIALTVSLSNQYNSSVFQSEVQHCSFTHKPLTIQCFQRLRNHSKCCSTQCHWWMEKKILMNNAASTPMSISI